MADLSYYIQRVGTQDIIRAHRRMLKQFFSRTATPLSVDDHIDQGGTLQFEVARIINSKWDPTTLEPL